MFGVIRPCRHGMCASLFDEWLAHLCGLCLTLRAEHGQAARLVTNYDGLLVSVLVAAQAPEQVPYRTAGRCALRGMKRAQVVDAHAEGARLAGAVSLLLAAGRTRDHLADGDGPYRRRAVAAAADRIAARWETAGTRTGTDLGFDTGVLIATVARQNEIEATPGAALLELTSPTETAVAAAFAHTAVLAAAPQNAETLAEAGRFFGRLAHLLDAVEDLADDRATGAFNPLAATGTDLATARRHCDDALHGLRLALAELDLRDRRLARALLDRQAGQAVDRVFGAAAAEPSADAPFADAPFADPADLHKVRRKRRPGFPVPCFTGTLVCVTCGVFQPDWSEHAGKSCDDRCWCSRHGDCGCDGCGEACNGCCECCRCCGDDGCGCDCCGCDC